MPSSMDVVWVGQLTQRGEYFKEKFCVISELGYVYITFSNKISLCLQSVTSIDLKKTAQYKSYELSFIWGKMSTIAWGGSILIPLGNCSNGVGGMSVHI